MRLLTLRIILFLGIAIVALVSFKPVHKYNASENLYLERTNKLEAALKEIIEFAGNKNTEFSILEKKADVRNKIHTARTCLKSLDFWYRYLEPVAYKKLNGPLPVEWETEAFEKFEKPYRREGAGLTLAELYLDNEDCTADSLIKLIQPSIKALEVFRADSNVSQLKNPDTYFLANRLFILNLASIYTTGFECPDTGRVIPELIGMIEDTYEIHRAYLNDPVLSKIAKEIAGNNLRDIVNSNPGGFQNEFSSKDRSFSGFSRTQFLILLQRAFLTNQEGINYLHIRSKNVNDYALNNLDFNSINFSWMNKNLYAAQNIYGTFAGIKDSGIQAEIRQIGKLLFYDPILSGNNRRSCASCHKSELFFTDTIRFALNFNGKDRLSRNTPSLLNVSMNHLLMLDGKHINLQDQAMGVITNPDEMGGKESEIVKKVLSVKTYKKALQKWLKLTPGSDKISLRHIVSTITSYAGSFSKGFKPNSLYGWSISASKGLNLFMGKAQCGTCHFFPFFGGVKPPFIGSEFEVVGTPEDPQYKKLSPDRGRFLINPAPETDHAFRTPSLLNVNRTGPYMHNGVFKTLEEVIEFYDAGGGVGHGLIVPNQTLSSDSLHLTPEEKFNLLAFLKNLDETIAIDPPPASLPRSHSKKLNARKVGGEY